MCVCTQHYIDGAMTANEATDSYDERTLTGGSECESVTFGRVASNAECSGEGELFQAAS